MGFAKKEFGMIPRTIARYGVRSAPGDEQVVTGAFRRGEAVSGPAVEEFEQEFARKLEAEGDSNVLILWASEKVLESYRNGITAGQKGATVKRQGKSRRRDSFGKAE